jgi:glycosyltransferase involved in cell wall biosynthesis
MRVLHVYKAYYPEDNTGVPNVINTLSEALFEKEVVSAVLAPYDRQFTAPFQVGRHIVFPARRNITIASSSMSVDIFGKFSRLVVDYDVIHYHFPWPLADLLHEFHGRGKPSVITYHSDIVRQKKLLPLYAPLMHRFLRHADAIVATSPQYLQSSSVLKDYADKVRIIPIGIPDHDAAPAGVEAWRTRVGSDFLLFVGAIRYYKGIEFLIQAARRTGLPIVIAGRDPDGVLDTAKLPGNVTYLGSISDSDKQALLTLSRAFVFPSHLRSEAFGIALLEAARAGRAMISCEIGTGTSFINQNNETGFTIPPADVDALADAMVRLHTDGELAARMGGAARRRYKEHFQAATMAEGYLDLYKSLVRARPQSRATAN